MKKNRITKVAEARNQASRSDFRFQFAFLIQANSERFDSLTSRRSAFSLPVYINIAASLRFRTAGTTGVSLRFSACRETRPRECFYVCSCSSNDPVASGISEKFFRAFEEAFAQRRVFVAAKLGKFLELPALFDVQM
jgi:hypothetical protein